MSENHGSMMSSQSGLNVVSTHAFSHNHSKAHSNVASSAGEVQHASYLSKDIGSLFLNDDYADVRLIVGMDEESVEFMAHKVILACRSNYFQALLFGGLRETGQQTIEIRDESSVLAFKLLLKYIYTGRLSLSSVKIEDILDVLSLAHKYGFSELESAVTDYVKVVMNVRNMCTVIASPFLSCLPALQQHCLDFADTHAHEILKTEGFLKLSVSTIELLISRDSFCAPEVEIFRAVREWILVNAPPVAEGQSDSTETAAENEAVRKRIFSKIRFQLMKLVELLDTVRPTELVPADVILDAIKEQTEKRNIDLSYRGFLVPDVNIATVAQGAQVMEGELRQCLLNGDYVNYDMERGFTRHHIEPDSSGIVVQLGMQFLINKIVLLLWDKDLRSYSYTVEVSMDQRDWIMVVDYSRFLCRSWQTIVFPTRVVKYIRVTGKHNSVNKVFHLVHFEAMTTSTWINYRIIFRYIRVTGKHNSVNKVFHLVHFEAMTTSTWINYRIIFRYIRVTGKHNSVNKVFHLVHFEAMTTSTWINYRIIFRYIRVTGKHNSVNKVFHLVHFEAMTTSTWINYRIIFRYIRVTGKHNSVNKVFHLVHFEAMTTSTWINYRIIFRYIRVTGKHNSVNKVFHLVHFEAMTTSTWINYRIIFRYIRVTGKHNSVNKVFHLVHFEAMTTSTWINYRIIFRYIRVTGKHNSVNKVFHLVHFEAMTTSTWINYRIIFRYIRVTGKHNSVNKVFHLVHFEAMTTSTWINYRIIFRYIRVTGKHNSVNKVFHLVHFEAMTTSTWINYRIIFRYIRVTGKHNSVNKVFHLVHFEAMTTSTWINYRIIFRYIRVTGKHNSVNKVFHLVHFEAMTTSTWINYRIIFRYIRVTGKHNSVNKVFHLVHFEAMCTTDYFNVDPGGIIIPVKNVADEKVGASVLEGVSRTRNALLNGSTDTYDWDTGYTCHQLSCGAIIVQLPQPFVIDSFRLLLWDCDDRKYSYYVEVSTDQQNWHRVVDRTDDQCRSWQFAQFKPVVVSFIRIVGTYNSANEVFHCVHFECPAQALPAALSSVDAEASTS